MWFDFCSPVLFVCLVGWLVVFVILVWESSFWIGFVFLLLFGFVFLLFVCFCVFLFSFGLVDCFFGFVMVFVDRLHQVFQMKIASINIMFAMFV